MPAAAPSVAPVRRRGLPATLYILAALMLAKGLALLAVAAAAAAGVDPAVLGEASAADILATVQATPGAAAVLGAFGALLLLSVLGIVSRRRLGWLLAMVITGGFVAVDILAFTEGTADHLWMLLNIVTVFYLNQADVREAVGATVTDVEPGPAPGVTA